MAEMRETEALQQFANFLVPTPPFHSYILEDPKDLLGGLYLFTIVEIKAEKTESISN